MMILRWCFLKYMIETEAYNNNVSNIGNRSFDITLPVKPT